MLFTDKSFIIKINECFNTFFLLISDDKKSVFDWCKEGNVKKLDALLIQGDSVNAEDDQVSCE